MYTRRQGGSLGNPRVETKGSTRHNKGNPKFALYELAFVWRRNIHISHEPGFSMFEVTFVLTYFSGSGIMDGLVRPTEDFLCFTNSVI
jgi:hypothetical protein